MTGSHRRDRVRVLLVGGPYGGQQHEVEQGEDGLPPEVIKRHIDPPTRGPQGQLVTQFINYYKRGHDKETDLWHYQYNRDPRNDW